MRIDTISFTKNSYYTNKKRNCTPVKTLPANKTYFAVGNFVSFKGYDKDRVFILSTKNALDNMIKRVVEFYSEDNRDFKNAVEVLYNKEEYNQLISSPENFKTYMKEFNTFNTNVLKSIDDVCFCDAQFGEFWCENSFIGSNKTSDLIRKITKAENKDINEIIKNLNNKETAKLKQNLTYEWFKNELKIIPNSEKITENNNQHLFQILENQIGKYDARSFKHQQTSHYINEFNKMTIDKIFNNKLSNEQKTEAVNTLLD